MRHNILLAGLVAMAAAACSESGTGPGTDGDAALNLSLATIAADGVAEDVDIMAGMSGQPGTINFSTAAALLGPPDGPGNTNGCGFGGGRWTCPANTANGITITRTVEFFDAVGESQEEYDAETTARIEVEAELEAEVNRGPWSAATHRARLMVFTGLEGAETSRTANGTALVDIERFREAGESPDRSFDLEGNVTIVDVVIPVRGEGVDPWPLSGTITRVYTVIRDGGDPVTKTVIVTFDGTSSPAATVDGEPFEFDLKNRRAQRR